MAIPSPIEVLQTDLDTIKSRIKHAFLSIKEHEERIEILKAEIIPELQGSEAACIAALDKLKIDDIKSNTPPAIRETTIKYLAKNQTKFTEEQLHKMSDQDMVTLFCKTEGIN